MKFISTFHKGSPEAVVLSGGEPLLRAELIIEIARILKKLGTSLILTTSLYSVENIPEIQMQALKKADYLAISIDRFHEKKVNRKSIFHFLHSYGDELGSIGIHTINDTENNYVKNLKEEINREFKGNIKIVTNELINSGRAESKNKTANRLSKIKPCSYVRWPLVHHDGTIYSCCNGILVDYLPSHLAVGSLLSLTWDEVVDHLGNKPLFRILSTFGPDVLTDSEYGSVCEKCVNLDKDILEDEITLSALTLSDGFPQLEEYFSLQKSPYFKIATGNNSKIDLVKGCL